MISPFVHNQVKSAKKELDKSLLDKYKKLTNDEIKELVIEDKWLTSICNSINEEMENTSHKLTSRINEFVERYETPLPELTKDVDVFTNKTKEHLEKMGFKP